MEASAHPESERRTWLWVAVMLAIILSKGFFAFFVVSDRGQPTWDYRPVLDVPASSPYANYPPLPFPQHIRGVQGE
jgi:hypothetical protein